VGSCPDGIHTHRPEDLGERCKTRGCARRVAVGRAFCRECTTGQQAEIRAKPQEARSEAESVDP